MTDPAAVTVVEFADGHDEPAGFYACGHHADDVFRAAVVVYVREQEGVASPERLDREIADALQDAVVWRGHWRTVPLRPEDPESDEERYERVEGTVEGSYPVTMMHVTW